MTEYGTRRYNRETEGNHGRPMSSTYRPGCKWGNILDMKNDPQVQSVENSEVMQQQPTATIIVATKGDVSALKTSAEVWKDLPADVELHLQSTICKQESIHLLDTLLGNRIITSYACEPDKGVYDAWNRALQRARGRWVLFYGDTDIPNCDWLTNLRKIPEEKYDFIFGSLSVIDSFGQKNIMIRDKFHTLTDIVETNNILHPGVAHSRRVFEKRRFDPKFKIAADKDMLIAAWPFSARYFPELTQGFFAPGGMSSDITSAALIRREFYMLKKKYNLKPSYRKLMHIEVRSVLSRFPNIYLALRKIRSIAYYRDKSPGS